MNGAAGCLTSLTRNPAENDPLMTQSQRTDFPRGLEREVVEGGVREGRLETSHGIGLVWLFVILIVILLVVGLAVNWGTIFP